MSGTVCVLASGSGTLLQALIDAEDIPIAAVVSDVPGCRALARAEAARLPTRTVPLEDFTSRDDWNAELTRVLQDTGAQWIVSAGFMRILGRPVLDAFPSRIVNTHPSLLPAFPGAHAVADALRYGVKITGCTVHVVDEGVDTGPILRQSAVTVAPDDDAAALHERIKAVERVLIVDVVRQLCREGEV